CDM
ncbi:hypothetical protein ECPA45_1865, partial [Escherichia coli PA45]